MKLHYEGQPFQGRGRRPTTSLDEAFLVTLEPYQARLVLGLRRALYERGWTQAEHARQSGLHETYLSKIMNGVKTPSQAVEDKLIAATGFPASQVIRWGEERIESLRMEKERHLLKRIETERSVEACLELVRSESLIEEDLLRIKHAVQKRLEALSEKPG